MFLIGFPLLLVPFAIYNIIAFLMPGVSWTGTLTTVHMVSGGDWSMSAGDMLVTLAILLLFGEMMKSTRIGIRTVVDHGLSLVLFLAMLVEFLLVKQAATATFFLLLVISFVDVLGGFAVTLRSAQRDLTVEGIAAHLVLTVSPCRFPMTRDFQLPGRSPVIACDGMAATSHPLATLGRDRYAARRRQCGRCRGGGGRHVVRGRAAHDRHRRRLLSAWCRSPASRCGAITAPAAPAPRRRTRRCARKGMTEIGNSIHAVTVPGALDAWEAILKTHGRFGLDRALAARDQICRRRLSGRRARRLGLEPVCRQAQGRSGRGEALSVQRRRAERRRCDPLSGAGRDLKTIAAKGARAFYEGEIADDMAKTVAARGSFLTAEDFAPPSRRRR